MESCLFCLSPHHESKNVSDLSLQDSLLLVNDLRELLKYKSQIRHSLSGLLKIKALNQ